METCDVVALFFNRNGLHPHGHSNGDWIVDLLYQFGALLLSLQLFVEGDSPCSVPYGD